MNSNTQYTNHLIGIIVLNYNGSSKNICCIKTIFGQTHLNFKLIFVDNSSDDDSILLVQNFCSENTIDSILLKETHIEKGKCYNQKLIIIKNSQNKGYSYGNNVGLKFAKSNIKNLSNILILNNDVLLPTNYLEKLLFNYNTLGANYTTKKLAISAAEYSLNQKKIHSGVHYLNLMSGLVFKYPIPPYYKYLVGASIFLDSNPPFFDNSYFLYFDDTEYTKILKDQNYKISLLKDTYYNHDQGFSTKKLKDLTAYTYTSMGIFYHKHYPKYILSVLAIRTIINLIKGDFNKNKLLYNNFFKNHTIKSS